MRDNLRENSCQIIIWIISQNKDTPIIVPEIAFRFITSLLQKQLLDNFGRCIIYVKVAIKLQLPRELMMLK